ncbi:hypothetical protein [Marinobacter halotolerans]|nr:hypothetical protein [Marinobacter halotolerans]
MSLDTRILVSMGLEPLAEVFSQPAASIHDIVKGILLGNEVMLDVQTMVR